MVISHTARTFEQTELRIYQKYIKYIKMAVHKKDKPSKRWNLGLILKTLFNIVEARFTNF